MYKNYNKLFSCFIYWGLCTTKNGGNCEKLAFYKNLMEEHINFKSATLTNKVYKIHT